VVLLRTARKDAVAQLREVGMSGLVRCHASRG